MSAIEMKSKTKRTMTLIFCVVLFLALQAATVALGAVQLSAFSGVCMAFQYGLCLIMLRVEPKKGVIVSMVLMGISVGLIIRAILVGRGIAPLPGLCNTVFYVITLLVLNHRNQIREKEIVTDVLTGLTNRRGLYKHLQEMIENQKNFSVVYVDLGNFKFINDNYGHAYGDELLRKIARRMGKVIGNRGTITRIGGDEFVVVLDGSIDPEETAIHLLNKIQDKALIEAGGSKVDCYLTSYAGIARYPEDTTDYESLIKYADIAMYQATKEKMDGPCFFNEDMAKHMAREIEVEKLIKEGLEHDYFYLVYQPQYHHKGKKLRGFESLLRMKTPDGNLVSPGEFIPVAEKGDLILQIDDYVLRRVMKEFKPIVNQSKDDLTISINVSAKNIGSLDFPDKVKRIMDELAFPASNLEIEITEYCLVQSVDITINNIKRLREMGVQVALDDFGTGYTSLNYLAKMPINLLKVDKSLVDDIEHDQKSLDFVHAVISMGHLMGCEVISEGVENETQLKLLGEKECDFIQGFVWGKPLEYEVAKRLVFAE